MKSLYSVVLVHPSLAWLLVFLPALVYFLSTRLPSLGFWKELGEPVTFDIWIPSRLGGVNESALVCSKLSEAFYFTSNPSCSDPESDGSLTSSLKLRYPLQLVQSVGLTNVVDMIWRHDSELGRGYVLISESSGNGRIWRWEVGGGPIAIGRTLHLDESGCRSNRCTEQHYIKVDDHVPIESKGSGAMAIDFYRAGNPLDHGISEGLLVVAEWGEGRIVRLETNGARTPLILQIPCMDRCPSTIHVEPRASCTQRIPNSNRMVFTPTGDLIVAVNYERAAGECRISDASSDNDQPVVEDSITKSVASLIVLPGAVHVEPLPSLQMSREAHGWEKIQNHNHSVGVLFSDPSILWIGGIALASPTKLYASATIFKGVDEPYATVIFEVLIGDDDDDDDVDDSSTDKMKECGTMKVLFDISEHDPTFQTAGAISVSRSGRIYVTVADGVLILDSIAGGLIGKIPIPKESPTALILGGDGYLYISSRSLLYRIRIKDRPIALPTNRVSKRFTRSTP
jgi:hypothetical protein